MEMLKLKNRIEELEQQLRASSTEPPKGSKGLASGEKEFSIDLVFKTTKEYETYSWDWSVEATWNELFFELSPMLVHEANTHQLQQRLTTFIADKAGAEFRKDKRSEVKGHSFKRSTVTPAVADLETIIIQFAALGYIVKSEKNRSVKDRSDYWTLAPYGATIMNQLRAIPDSDE